MGHAVHKDLPVRATVEHCAFAVHEIHALDASRTEFGGKWPWYEILIRPHASVFAGSPGHFVDRLYSERAPALSDLEVVRRVGKWLACRDTPTRASINTHPVSLLDETFIAEVLRQQRHMMRSEHSICIELIEFGDCADRARLVRNAQRLRDEGVLIALDDFGSRLNCFDLCAAGIVDVVKIDISVVSRLHADGNQRAIVESIRTLGDGLGAWVVAEGVETTEECEALELLRVDFAQGFHFHKPEIAEI